METRILVDNKGNEVFKITLPKETSREDWAKAFEEKFKEVILNGSCKT